MRSLRRWRVAGRPLLRRTASVVTALAAIFATGLVAGPVTAAVLPGGCMLPRTDAHHSEGLDTWNTDYPRPNRPLDALMLFFSFPDWDPFVSPAALVRDHFPVTSDFFVRASYGRFDLRIHPREKWIEMPTASTAYGIRRDWDPELRAAYLRDALAAADPLTDFGEYDVVYLVADPDAPGVNSDATKVVNFDEPLLLDGVEVDRVVTVFEHHPPDRYVLAHETGHAFDLPDLYHRPEDGQSLGDWDTYVGDWDVMGSQFGLAPDPFGWHKWKLGWLERANVDCVPRDTGTTQHALRALGAPLDVVKRPDTRLIVIPTGPFEVLAIEARAPVGNDVGVCTSGVLVYRVRSDANSADGPVQVLDGHPESSACRQSSVYPPLADAPLRRGDTYTLGDDGGVRIRVGERAAPGGGWGVEITRGPEALE